MRLLLTNDDGILSPVLYRVAEGLSKDHEIVVVAPSVDQSGKSHSFTHGPHRLLHYREEKDTSFPAFQVQGTPSDCVKFAISHLFRSQPFDMVISGINLGENAGISSIYSGTVAAAREGALWGIPGLALSLWHHTPAHLEHSLAWLCAFLTQPDLLPRPGEFFNINFPACPVSEVAGARFASMSEVMFSDAYVPVVDDHGVTGYRLEGHKPGQRFAVGTDDKALQENHIAIVPMRIAQFYPEAVARLQARQEALDTITRASRPLA